MHPDYDNRSLSRHQKIHLNESWEINHWCEELNIRADELREIVKKVGNDIQAVRNILARRSMRRESPF